VKAKEPEAPVAREPEPEPFAQIQRKPEPVAQPELVSVANAAPVKPAETAPSSLISKFRRSLVGSAPAAATPALFEDDRPFAEPEVSSRAKPAPAPEAKSPVEEVPVLAIDGEDTASNTDVADLDDDEVEQEATAVVIAEFIAKDPVVSKEEIVDTYVEAEPDPDPIEMVDDLGAPELESSGFTPIPRKRPPGVTPWSTAKGPKALSPEIDHIDAPEPVAPAPAVAAAPAAAAPGEAETPKLKLGIKPASPQSELSLDSAPRGRFEGESPNVFEGEDLDLPPFLRKKK